jgi:hypothetical protein
LISCPNLAEELMWYTWTICQKPEDLVEVDRHAHRRTTVIGRLPKHHHPFASDPTANALTANAAVGLLP